MDQEQMLVATSAVFHFPLNSGLGSGNHIKPNLMMFLTIFKEQRYTMYLSAFCTAKHHNKMFTKGMRESLKEM